MLEATVRHTGKLIGVVCHEHIGPMRNWLLDEQSFAASIADMVAIVLEAEARGRLAEALARARSATATSSSLSTEGILRVEISPPLDPTWPFADQVAHTGVTAWSRSATPRSRRCSAPRSRSRSSAARSSRCYVPTPPSLTRVDRVGLPPLRVRDRSRRPRRRDALAPRLDGRRHGRWQSRALWSSLRDITQRKEAMLALEHQANHDSLTGLPNRKWLGERLARCRSRRAQTGDGLALLMMDLDHFKEINDTLGHFAGDQLLKLIGPRLEPLLARARRRARAARRRRVRGDSAPLRRPRRAVALADDVVAACASRSRSGSLRWVSTPRSARRSLPRTAATRPR